MKRLVLAAVAATIAVGGLGATAAEAQYWDHPHYRHYDRGYGYGYGRGWHRGWYHHDYYRYDRPYWRHHGYYRDGYWR